MGEILFLLIISGAAGLYFYQATGYRMPRLDNSGGPAIFPKFVCAILICLIIIRIITILSKKEFKKFHFFDLFKGSMGIFFISFVILVLIIKPVGFVLTSFLFLSFTINYLFYFKNGTFGHTGSIVLREIVFVLFTLVLYFFFTKILYIALPAGILKGTL